MGEARLPKNLQGLLRFCMQVGDDLPTTVAPMDPERGRWLREAMDGLTVDIGKQLRENIGKILQNADLATSGDADAFVACLNCVEDTMDLCENLDLANDFVKLEGLDVVAYVCQRCSENESARNNELRALALHLMARVFQNNPFAQAAGLGCVSDLVKIINGCCGGDPDVRFAALSALSCLVRDCPPALGTCAEVGGLAAIASCLRLSGCGSESGARLRRKAAFLLACLATESDALADRLAGVDGLLDALADSVLSVNATETEDAEINFDWVEHALRCLLLLCQRPCLRESRCGVWRERLNIGLASLHRDKRLTSDCIELTDQLLVLLSQERDDVSLDK